MARLSVSGVPDELKEAVGELANEYNIPMGRVVIAALREHLKDRDDVPEWLLKEIEYDHITDKNNWRVRVAFLPSEIREFMERALEKDVPPEPEKLEWALEESYREQIESEVPDRWADEYRDTLKEEMERYRVEYDKQEGDGVVPRSEAVEKAARHIEFGKRQDLAVEYIKSLDEQDRLPVGIDTTRIMKQARQRAAERNGSEGEINLVDDREIES